MIIMTTSRHRPKVMGDWASTLTAPVRFIANVAGDVVQPITKLSDQVTSGIKSTIDIFHPPAVAPPPPSNTPIVLAVGAAAVLLLGIALMSRRPAT